MPVEGWEWISADRTAGSRTGEADVLGRQPRRRARRAETMAGRPAGRRTALAAADGGLSGSARRVRRKQRRRRVRRRRVVAALLLALAPVLYSYASTMMQPSSLPLGIRTVEWIRGHQGAWLVNDLERLYYGWNAPSKGGPALRVLPTVGAATVRGVSTQVGYRTWASCSDSAAASRG